MHTEIVGTLRGRQVVYAVARVVRYALTQSPEMPAAFHFVRAGYLYTLGRLHQAKDATGV